MRTQTLKPYLAIILTLALSVIGVQAQFTFSHVGGGETGSITPNAEPGSYTFVGGGNDIWSGSDEFDFAHTTVSGNFDVRVRVESLEFVATWTKAGLMARESLNGNSRMAFNRVTPSAGANDTRYAYRTGSTSGAQGEHEDGSGQPGFPNAWLRLTRAGSVLSAYASSDGLNWRELGRQDTVAWEGGAVGADLLVGLAVSRHSGADPLATAEFRDFGYAATTPAAISTQPASQTVEEGFAATLSFRAVGGLDIYDIQWKKNGADIPGATGISYTTAPLAGTDNGTSYSVAIRNKNNGTTATSADAIITVVPDTTKPALASVGTTPGIANRAVVVFTEPVNQSDAQNLANYTLTGATATSATLQADNKTVHLATSPLGTSTCKELTVRNIRDRASVPNTMDPATQNFIYADGSIRYNAYFSIGGVNVSDLTGNAKFPNSPDVTGFQSVAENPNGGGGEGDNYGGRLVGYVTPAASGDYTFYIAADDGAVLYLSTDENPANKVAIATEPIWSGFRTYTGEAGGGGRGGCSAERPSCNISLPKSLVCGQRYYIEGLWKEGGGGDHMSIAWQPPGTGIPTGPIGAANLSPLNPQAVTLAAGLPADTTISENQNLILTINVTAGTPALNVQWYKNGTAIPGANSTTFRIDNAKIPDSGTYHATVQNGLGVATSRSANVSVIVDTVPPAPLTAIAAAGDDTHFDVVFSEPINQADAQNTANYSLPGVSISSAALQADGKTVKITSSSLYGPGCKILTVNNIRDRAIPPNTAMNAMVGVVAAKGSIRYMEYRGIGGTAVANLTSNPKYPNSADRILNVPDFENVDRDGDNMNDYGVLMQGFVHPPVSGDYIFHLSSDDNSILWLSTDENPANKVPIASEPQWGGYREWNGNAGGRRACPGGACENISRPITLQAGCKYFVEFIYKEGGGGDYGSVTWRLPGAPVPANGSPPIQGTYLSPYEVAASIPAAEPADVDALEGRYVTFTANITGSPNLAIQWYRDGSPITDATGKSITIGPVRYPEDNNATFYVTAQNSLGSATSRTATLRVTEDIEPPALAAAAGSTTFDRVTVTYNEIVDEQSAADEFSYTLSDGVNALTIIAADLLADGKTVLITLDPTTPLQLDREYTVSAQGVLDISGNVMDTGSAMFHSAVEGCGGIVFEAYNTSDVPGNAVSILTGHPTYPNNPDFRMTIPGLDSRLAYPSDAREQYGARMRGVYVPPYSGQWVLYLRSDDASELWFNKNGIDPAGKQLVQQETGCCQAFEALPTAPMDLIGGRPYYIEVLYKEGGGGDYAQVAARPVGSADALVPIGARDVGQYAEPGYSGSLTVSGPTDQTVLEGRVATFSIAAESSMGLPICYQWSRDGSPIAGANGASYSLRATLGDNGAVFTARASIVGNVVNSAAATLTVTPDTEAPRIVSASGTDTLRNVIINFDEQLDPTSAGDEFNYSIAGLTVEGADLMANGSSVKLTTSEQTQGTVYTVTVTGVKDTSSAGTAIGSADVNFTAWAFSPGFLRFDYFNNLSTADNALDTTLLADPRYPDSPTATYYMSAFDTRTVFPDNSHEGYGGRVSGAVVPPISGNWLFYLASDDSSRLFLNPAGYNPNGNGLIVEEPGCCGVWTSHVSGPIPLTAGGIYSIAGIFKEGTGGDYLKVAAGLEGTPAPPDNPNQQMPVSAYAIPAPYIGVMADPTTGASGQITRQPSDTTACINPLLPAQDPVILSLDVATAPAGVPSHVRWEKLSGGQWVGAGSGTSLTLSPSLSDSGTKYRASLYVLGLAAPVVSDEITLTVLQANTPPTFDLGSSASASEDSGAQSVPGFASNVKVHSIPRNPVAFASAFNSAAGLTLYGIAGVSDGVLKLTTPINSSYGAAALTAPQQTYESLEVSWKSLIGGGTDGADGYSLSIGDALAGDPGYGGEEGKGDDLIIAVDTFNNAELRPGGVDDGIGILYGGNSAFNNELAFQHMPKNDDGTGVYLRKNQFVDAKVTVTASGLVTLTYDGNTISGQIPNYTGITANRALFWARTGGANDNHWIDDLDIKAFPFDRSSVESSQQVSFEVSNDNPSLFSSQPAISPDGTLTFTPAPNACGSAVVSVVARDDGGTACNGDDASDAKTFTIDIAPVNDCPVADGQAVGAQAGQPKTINLTGTDIDANGCGSAALTCALASPPSHGTVVLNGCQAVYTANAGYTGPDSFTFTVSDGTCTSPAATVNISVRACELHCVANVAPADCGVTFPNSGKTYAISVDGGAVCLALDGSQSSSTGVDCPPLSFTWVIDGTNTQSGAVTTACLAPGCHQITLIATDGAGSCQQTIEVCVITASEICEQIIALVESTPVERKNKRPLIVSLKAAKAAFEQAGLKEGGQMLQVFQHKVRAQISRNNPGEAATFDAAVQDVLRAVECSVNLPPAGLNK